MTASRMQKWAIISSADRQLQTSFLFWNNTKMLTVWSVFHFTDNFEESSVHENYILLTELFHSPITSDEMAKYPMTK